MLLYVWKKTDPLPFKCGSVKKIFMTFLKQAHEVGKDHNEPIMLSRTVLKIFMVMKVWPLKMNFRHWNEGHGQISWLSFITFILKMSYIANLYT
jgi:hypothetical protein